MTRALMFCGLILILSRPAAAETAADVPPLPLDEFQKILIERPVTLDPQTVKLILALKDDAGNQVPEVQGIAEKLRLGGPSPTFRNLLPIVDRKDSQEICARLANSDDSVLKFLACLSLAASGDSKAAKSVYELIHSEAPSALEKRLIKTWCLGVGIQPQTDDLAGISDHLLSMRRDSAKFKPGDAAPDFTVTTEAGKELTLKLCQGKLVVLHFWATWCSPCMSRMPDVVKQLEGFSDDEVVILFVSLDSERSKFEEALQIHQMPAHQVFEAGGWGSPLARLFGVNHVPFDVVIGRDGKVMSNSLDDLERARAEKGKPSTP